MTDLLSRLRSGVELVVDNFAGGGGASEGIRQAIGRAPDISINHDHEAVAMHTLNHPLTHHYCEDVWQVNPAKVCAGKPVGLAWFSPDCKYFSKAKGGKPVSEGVRGLAWVVVKWAKAVKPRVIILENVEEFAQWGPLTDDGLPCPLRKGLTFRRWVTQLENCGYHVEWRELRACDYGVPTIRKRLFLVARCDGAPIAWPEPTHAEPKHLARTPGLKPWRTAADCIDWTIPCPSIFERDRPLAENTLRRIAAGVHRFVLEANEPFIINLTHGVRAESITNPMRTVTSAHRGEKALVVPTVIQTGYGERENQAPRVPGINKPLGTVVAGGGKHALVTAFLAKHYGGVVGNRLTEPCGTITTIDHHALVASSLVKLYGTCKDGRPVTEPLATVSAGGQHLAEVRTLLQRYVGPHAFPQCTIAGVPYLIADIGMRMLSPRELYRAQGFPESYKIDFVLDGQPLSKTAQVRMCGNSVCPALAAAMVRAQVSVDAQFAAVG